MTRPDVFGLAREVIAYTDGLGKLDARRLATALLALEPLYLAACDYADTRNGPRWRETAIAIETAAHTARAALGREGE